MADPNTQWAYNGAKHWNGGGMHKSDDYGFGKVDARAAVRLAESWSASSTLENEHHVGAARTPINLAVSSGEAARSVHELPAGIKVEHVEVDLYSEVGQLGDLQLRLTSPSGTQSLLLDRVGKKRSGEGAGKADRGSERSGAFNYSFMSTQHWGERSQGTWTLEAINADGGKPLTLNSWGLRAYGEATSADDHYVYTDAFATLAGEPSRALLDDAAMGTAGGFNTLNAAAMSGDVTVDLQSGNATLAGKPLNIVAPGHFGHVITGDGNDRLVASGVGTVLEGGRGSNTLIGGTGKDLYVVRQRRGGEDTIHGFEAAKGELINFSGTGVGSFENLTLTQEGPHTHVALPDGQRLVIADTALATVSADHVRFDRQLKLPNGYFDSIGTVAPALPALAPGDVVLKGGAKSVGLTFGAEGAAAKLLGTVYERNDAGPATFVVARQEGVTKLSNALRGFNPGTDVIDVAQLGVSSWSELVIEKQERVVINGIALANGTSIKTKPDAQGRSIDVVYIDGLDPNRLSEQHLRFAPAGSTPYLPDASSNVPQPLLAAPLPPPVNLLQAMAGFAPEAAGSNSTVFKPRQHHYDTLLTQVA